MARMTWAIRFFGLTMILGLVPGLIALPSMLATTATVFAEPGFSEKYERGYNIFNPANRYAPDNPLNPAQTYAPDNPFNSANRYDPGNPVNPANRYNPNTPFEPLNRTH